MSKLLRFPEVRAKINLSRATIWRLEREGLFPRRRLVTANVVAWDEAEIDAWLRSRHQGQGCTPAIHAKTMRVRSPK